MTDHDTTPSRWITFADLEEAPKSPWYCRALRTLGAWLPARRRPLPFDRVPWPAERPIPGKRL